MGWLKLELLLELWLEGVCEKGFQEKIFTANQCLIWELDFYIVFFINLVIVECFPLFF